MFLLILQLDHRSRLPIREFVWPKPYHKDENQLFKPYFLSSGFIIIVSGVRMYEK